MTSYLWLTSITFALVLNVSCQARAGSSGDERELIKILSTQEDLNSPRHTTYTLRHSPDLSLHDTASASSEVPFSSLGYSHFIHEPVVVSEDGRDNRPPISRHRSRIPADVYADIVGRLRSVIPLELVDVAASAMEAEKRYKPSGFQGSRGKRFIPGLQTLLLTSYFQDAEKWKRQPHKGFHGTRG